jgi:hypothetical protein
MDLNKNTNDKKLAEAKKKVEELKGFYVHLTAYILVNFFLLLGALGVFENGFVNLHMPDWGYFTTPFFWGIGVLAHGLYVFNIKMFKNWEERKIKEYIEKEEQEFEKFNN